ncbi:MAG: hypothetical protein K2G77_05205 [Muribaculaceae bacterium]|nr:hypothetical protein [Muribaculaceae bacterium]
MKKLLVIIALIFSSFSLYAQGGDNHWGIQASFDINIPSKIGGRLNGEKLDLFRMGYGGSVGAVYSHWFNDVIFLEPGVSLFYDTYSYRDMIIEDGMTNKSEIDPSLYKLCVRVPLVVGYSYYLLDSLPMRVYTGPELSYSFAGQIRIKNKSLISDSDFNTDLFGKNGFMNPFVFDWKIGLGFDTDFATVCVEAAIGISDVYKDYLKLRENRVSVSVTHYF